TTDRRPNSLLARARNSWYAPFACVSRGRRQRVRCGASARSRDDWTGSASMHVSAGWTNGFGRIALCVVFSLTGLLAACSGKPAADTAAAAKAEAAPAAADRPAVPDSQSGFVTVEGTHFVLDGKPYRFAGANFWYGAYLGAPDGVGDRERLRAELDQLKAAGIDNLRVLAMSEASGFRRGVRPAFMVAPGEYDQRLLEGLDVLLDEM